MPVPALGFRENAAPECADRGIDNDGWQAKFVLRVSAGEGFSALAGFWFPGRCGSRTCMLLSGLCAAGSS